jgi:hypothetical protein
VTSNTSLAAPPLRQRGGPTPGNVVDVARGGADDVHLTGPAGPEVVPTLWQQGGPFRMAGDTSGP